jgi:pimeloyl-ACP methyl ester carboxylesterase
VKSYFVNNQSVWIHVLENGVPSDQRPSLLVIGGLWEPAERAVPILSGLSSHGVALSLRGRGLSSTPETGYDLDDHLSDIESVVSHCQLKNYVVLGFSRGASYALGWSLKHQQEMAGLILVDQPPVHFKPGAGYVEYWSNLKYQGIPILNFMRRQALEGLERESTQIDFSGQLAQLKISVCFFVGKNKEAKIPSDITEEIVQRYRQTIAQCEVVEFLKSGHMIPDDEQAKYISEIAAFVHSVSVKH